MARSQSHALLAADTIVHLVEVPSLHTIGRFAWVNVGLDLVELPALTTALDHLSAYDNAALTAWRLPAITQAVEVYLDNNPLHLEDPEPEPAAPALVKGYGNTASSRFVPVVMAPAAGGGGGGPP